MKNLIAKVWHTAKDAVTDSTVWAWGHRKALVTALASVITLTCKNYTAAYKIAKLILGSVQTGDDVSVDKLEDLIDELKGNK